MAEFIMKDIVEKAGIKDQFLIASAATSSEEIWNGVGNPVYPPAAAELRRRGIGKTPYTDFSGKRAVQVTKADHARYDLLLCADKANIQNTQRITGPDTEGKIKLLLEYAGKPGQSISDPWYTGDFARACDDIVEGCNGLMAHLMRKGLV